MWLVASILLALPGGYQELEKGLPLDGGQWIETGYCPAAGDRFECEVTVADDQPNASAALFGTVRELEPERTFAFYVRQGGDDSTVVAYGDMARGGFFPRGKRVTLSVGPDGAAWTWDGGANRIELTPGFALDGMTPLLIGDANAAGLVGGSVPAGMGAAMTLHRFRIWRGGLELVHDYVPSRNPSGEIGLYDHKYASFLKIKPQPDNVLRDVPYRTWDAERSVMVDCICSNAIPVTADTATFEDGRWYAVTGTVSRGSIRVGGSAHLILCDCARLTAIGAYNFTGVNVGDGCSLSIYGQIAGTGALTATGSGNGVGIGGGGANGSAGMVTINGGIVTATGENGCAGIGGAYMGNGGTVTVNGGTVTAKSGAYGAGIGGGYYGAGGKVTINGGTVVATGGINVADIGKGYFGNNDGTLTIDGGSVKAARVARGLAKNSTPTNVYCVTVKVEGLKVEKLKVEGLENYGTNDIYAIDNRVYLWLPDGMHRFSVSDGATTNRYCVVVHGRGVTVEPLGPIGFFVNGEDIGDTGSGTGWNYNKNMKNLTLSEVGLYVLSGVAMNDEVHIHVAGEKAAGATVILSNAVVFVSGQPPALNVDQNISLLMAGGSSFLGATNNVMAISVGPKAALTVGLAPGADETEAIIGVFNYGDVAAIGGAGSVTVRGGTLAVWADKRAAETPINRTADVFCMLAGNDLETAKVVDTYNGELCVLVTAAIAPVTPGKPFGSFTTAEAATNVMKKAVLVPRDDVAKVLISEGLRRTYCDMFALAVTGGGESWFVEAVLTPTARTNLAETATAATRQIPVAAIARLPEDVMTNVTVQGCAPGFFYSLYGGWALMNIVADANVTNLNVLCGADAKVTFPEVKKPSEKTGFFTVGVDVSDGVKPGMVWRR